MQNSNRSFDSRLKVGNLPRDLIDAIVNHASVFDCVSTLVFTDKYICKVINESIKSSKFLAVSGSHEILEIEIVTKFRKFVCN